MSTDTRTLSFSLSLLEFRLLSVKLHEVYIDINFMGNKNEGLFAFVNGSTRDPLSVPVAELFRR